MSDEIKGIQAMDKANEKGFNEVMSSQNESEKARDKFAKETSEQIKGDGAAAKDPVDKAGLSDEAKEEKKAQ
ncbi:MAG: hypothetical protein RDV48_26090 [Candidatus Eremiobacteraeota bacterium]|nr:hypothetical protein [Candidatus Eremiobacteraeota bacterium]